MNTNTYYNIIMTGLSALCFTIIAVTLLNMSCTHNKITKQFERYNALIEQYDTTTNYNRMVLYPKIKAVSDSILSEK